MLSDPSTEGNLDCLEIIALQSAVRIYHLFTAIPRGADVWLLLTLSFANGDLTATITFVYLLLYVKFLIFSVSF